MSSSSPTRKTKSDCCAACGDSNDNKLMQCSGCKLVVYCSPDHQRQHWKAHKPNCFIPGTKIPRSTPKSPNPLDASYPIGRTGKTPRDPLRSMTHFKYEKSGAAKMRLLKPGTLTPVTDELETPYEDQGSKQVPLASGCYRHIASYSLKELLQMGWDGAKYNSTDTLPGLYVPFVCGYDSDPDNVYVTLTNNDIVKARKEGLVGLPKSEEGLYMEVPDPSKSHDGMMQASLVKLNPN